MRAPHIARRAAGFGGRALLLVFGVAGGAAQAQDGVGASAAGPAAQTDTTSLPVIPVPDEPAPVTAPPVEAEQKDIETIVVTATKREESVREIPASITAISGSELEKRGAQNLKDLVKLVPGVNVTEPAGNATRVTIRGVAGEANTNPTAGILFGNVSFTDAYVPHVTLDPNPFDLQDVEVLKGPQGTLFGASALNGAIRYVPQAPKFGVSEGKYYAQYRDVHQGSEAFGYGGALNVPVGDRFAMRAVAFDDMVPGYIDNLRTGRDDSNTGRMYGVRDMLAWRPTDALDIDLTWAYQRTRQDDSSEADNYDGDLSANNRPRPSPLRKMYNLANLSVGYQFDGFRLVSESAYLWKHYWGTQESSASVEEDADHPIIEIIGNERSHTWSQELRLVSDDDGSQRWRWVAGVFASEQHIWQVGTYPIGDPSVSPVQTALDVNNALPGLGVLWLALGRPDFNDSDIDVRVRELAGFFDLTRRLGDAWELELGGRLYKTSSGGTVDNSGLAMDVLSLQSGGHQHLDDTVRDQGFSPRTSLLWHASDNALFYGAASKGYRVGGVQWGTSGLAGLGGEPAPETFKTDSIWNYEIGTRTQWFHGLLNLDATAFYEDWKNPQVLILDDTGLSSYIDNVGAVGIKGVEGAMQMLVPWVRGLAFRATASYTDAKTTEAYNSASNQTVPSGTPWPLSPKWQLASTLNYRHNTGTFTYGGYLSYAYLSKATYGITQSDPIFGYGLLEAQLSIGTALLPTAPELSLTVANLLDKRGLDTAYSGDTFTSADYTRPRTLILRLTGEF